MYGQIHCCIRSLVIEKFGQGAWKKILEAAVDCDETRDFMVFHQYSDEQTLRLVGAAASTLGLEVCTVLETFGEYFLDYCINIGYDKMLRALGADFVTFIQNLDSLHALLALSYKNMEAPSFRCEENADGSLSLHYYSYRCGLYPIVQGMIRAVGKRLFNTDVSISVVRHTDDLTAVISGVNGRTFKEYCQFRVILNSTVSVVSTKRVKSRVPSNCGIKGTGALNGGSSDSHVNADIFCETFPYHIIFDRNMKLLQVGNGIRSFGLVLRQDGLTSMTDNFELIHPQMNICYSNIMHFVNAVFIIRMTSTGANSRAQSADRNQSTLLLKGQVIPLDEAGKLMFMGSPRISSLTELLARNIYLSDIPIYDVTRELVLLNHQRIAEIEISKKLDETTAELKKTAIALELEKEKTDFLLHQMLPMKVAEQLKAGKKVEAEKFSEVTIFFSDIVTFTNIASASTPMEILDMLNTLYESFDSLTSLHGVYKVETIGDAYMVVCGVPEPVSNHAQRVAAFALAASRTAKNVRSPVTGLPLQIRIGIHTGPVVAGVVGKKMPRYCLFGDTVNTASRMESHGVPDGVHVSHDTYKALVNKSSYKFVERGEVNIKGKGLMRTYFIAGDTDLTLEVSKKPEKETPEPTVQLKKMSASSQTDEQVTDLHARPPTDSVGRAVAIRKKSAVCAVQ